MAFLISKLKFLFVVKNSGIKQMNLIGKYCGVFTLIKKQQVKP